jgi:hypothetical protein
MFLFTSLSFLILPCCWAETIAFLIEDSPYYVGQDLVIEKDQTFTAEPGVVIEIAKNVGIIVKGRINICGYPKNGAIIFKARGPHRNYHKGFWQGIVIKSGEKNSISYAVIQHSKVGIEAAKGSSVDITNNIITQNKTGVKAEGPGEFFIARNSFLGNFTDIEIADSAGSITRNFFQGSLIGIKLSQAYPKIENNYFKELHKYAVVSSNERALRLDKNWWGSADKEKIQGLIFEEGEGKINFEPFLREPPGLGEESSLDLKNNCASCR